ncbi:MAG: nucleotidyl transferase AbiEii/AbiGii toxin family protein [Gammaproteobacteria bacterium]
MIHLLNRFSEDPYLHNRFVLKGGTALNLFCFDYPRLSVDIDINYIGSSEHEVMLQEKQSVEAAIENIILNENFSLQRKPTEHSGGKWAIRYPSAVRGQGIIEVDLNFLDRVPLWPIKQLSSFKLNQFQAINIPVQDIHELAAGKLRALFSRNSSRDLFDAYLLLINDEIDMEKLRLGFIVYGASSRVDWRNIKKI